MLAEDDIRNIGLGPPEVIPSTPWESLTSVWGSYVFNLLRERWVVRAVHRLPENARRVGRPAFPRDSMIQRFCRHKQIGTWRERARHFFWDEPIRATPNFYNVDANHRKWNEIQAEASFQSTSATFLRTWALDFFHSCSSCAWRLTRKKMNFFKCRQ